MKQFYIFLLVLFFIPIFLFANEFFYQQDELKSGYIIAEEVYLTNNIIELPTNKVEILKFTPNFKFLDAGDIHCIVDFFIQYCQVSTNFCNYDFARNKNNNILDELQIHFIDKNTNNILTIPCINNGQDMVWDMECSRLVQLYGSFIFTYGRCEQLKNYAIGFYISDKYGNLLDDNNNKIYHILSENERQALIEKPFLKMKNVFYTVNKQ